MARQTKQKKKENRSNANRSGPSRSHFSIIFIVHVLKLCTVANSGDGGRRKKSGTSPKRLSKEERQAQQRKVAAAGAHNTRLSLVSCSILTDACLHSEEGTDSGRAATAEADAAGESQAQSRRGSVKGNEQRGGGARRRADAGSSRAEAEGGLRRSERTDAQEQPELREETVSDQAGVCLVVGCEMRARYILLGARCITIFLCKSILE